MLYRMTPENRDQNGRRLIDEIQFLTIFLSTVIIVVVQAVSMTIISYSMGNRLYKDAERVSDELAVYLAEPMYNVDDQQSILVAEAMLSSGRLSGIELVSAASGSLLSKMIGDESRYIEPITRQVYRDSLFLGTVTLHFSDAEIIGTRNRFVFIGIMVILAVFLVNVAGNRFFLQKKIVRSLQPIVDGIGSIRMGDYSSRIEVTRYADVNLLIGLINDMAASILVKKSELVEANTLLENRVEERTGELLQSLAELRQAQDRLVESGKLSALGLLAAGMAHELNTPLGAILSSNRTIMDFFDAKINDLYDFFTSMNNNELALYTRAMELGAQSSRTLDTPELSRAQLRDIRAMLAEAGVQDSRIVAEYLAEMGIPPEDSVMQNLLLAPRASHILKYVSDILATRRMAEIVDVAGKKAAAVVSALRFYLSPDSADMEGVVSLEDDIEQILTLMHNMLKHGITVRRELSGVKTRGSSEKLGQVWMNIIRNAAQAMDFKGELTIKTEASASRAIVSFIDSGPGIPDAVLPHIFEPFFTTKQHGEGMGLGLDICRRIIEAHEGTIEVETRPGQTEFRIILPLI